MLCMLICTLLIIQPITAMDGEENVLAPVPICNNDQDNNTCFQKIKCAMVRGIGLADVTRDEVERLTPQQLGAIGDDLVRCHAQMPCAPAYRNEVTFWAHVMCMRRDLARGGSGYGQYQNRKEHIAVLHKRLLRQLMERGNSIHDPNPSHLVDTDSMYYLQRRLMQSTHDCHGDPEMCTAIQSMIITGAKLTLIDFHDMHNLSVQELDAIKKQLEIYDRAHHAARQKWDHEAFWEHITCLRDGSESGKVHAQQRDHADGAR